MTAPENQSTADDHGQMKSKPSRIREILQSDELAIACNTHDSLTARIAEHYGFDACLLGGWDLGAVLAITEPLITETETVEACRYIKRAVDLPLIVDGGTGFGEPVHLVRFIEDCKVIGVDMVQIEDQHYPKRVHYYKDYDEEVVELDVLVERIHWAKKTGGEDVLILARTDSYKTDNAAEGIRRLKACIEVGADAVTAFPRDLDEAKELPRKVDAPVFYANTHGNRVGRPMLTAKQAENFGYRMLWDAHGLLFPAYAAMASAAARFSREDGWAFDDNTIDVRAELGEMIGLSRLLGIEAETSMSKS